MKALNGFVLLGALIVSACGTKNEQRNPVILEKKLPDLSNPSTQNMAPVNKKFPAYTWNQDQNRTLWLENKSVERSGKQVIVNAANEWMAYGGSGGAHRSIISNAGPDIIDADVKQQKGRFFRQMNGEDNLGGNAYILNPGEALTTTAGNLKSSGTQYIIHGVGPRFGSTVTLEKADVLKQVYTNIFAEMEKLHASDTSLKEIALMPISGGIFSGGNQNIPKICDVLIQGVSTAMGKYEWLVPTVCGLDKDMFEIIKQRIEADESFLLMVPGSSSSSLALGFVSSVKSTLHLCANSFYEGRLGALSLNGGACSVGEYRLVGSLSQFANRNTANIGLGRMFGQTFVGCEVESSSVNRTLNYCAFKGIGMVPMSDHVALLGAVGYVRENKMINLPQNMQQFLHRFDIDADAFVSKGLLVDAAVQGSVVSLAGEKARITTGARVVANSYTTFVSPFIQLNMELNSVNVSGILTTKECGFSIAMHQ